MYHIECHGFKTAWHVHFTDAVYEIICLLIKNGLIEVETPKKSIDFDEVRDRMFNENGWMPLHDGLKMDRNGNIAGGLKLKEHEAKIIETGEIIDVLVNYYPTIYKENRQRGREFYEEDLEFLDKPKKMVSLDSICNWLKEKYKDYANNELGVDYLINDLKVEFE